MSMASYILRKIDPDFWHRVKTKALKEKRTGLRDLILDLLTQWLKVPTR